MIAPSVPTVKQLTLQWFEAVVRRKVKESTYVGYLDECNRHLFRLLGDVPVDELNFQHVQNAMNKLVDEVSVRVAHYNHHHLRGGVRYAVKCDYITKNPADDVELPKLKTPKRTPPTIKNLRRLRRKNQGHRLLLLIDLICLFGTRKGEGLGVRWSDIDWQRAELSLRQQVKYFRRKDKNDRGRVGIDTLKTEDSHRVLPIPPGMLERLQKERLRQKQAVELARDTWSEDVLIFRTSNGTPFQPRNFSRDYKPMLEKAKLPLDFTSTIFGGALLPRWEMRGIPDRVVAALLGHVTNVEVTWRYMNAEQSMRRAVELLENSLFAPTTAEEEEEDKREENGNNQEGKDE